MDAAGVQIAQAVASLGATGILALIFILWLAGRIHSDTESKAARQEWDEAMTYREQLRQEAIEDRRASDNRLEQLAKTLAESNDLTRRALDLNERLVDENLRKRGRDD